MMIVSKDLVVFQQNLQHSRAATANLSQQLTEGAGKCSEIYLLQEPYVYKGRLCGLPLYT